MNRCPTRPLLALCLSLLVALPAQAQSLQRPFPKEALRGTLVVTQPPYVKMDDRDGRLSPGARIRNTNNNVVRPSSLLNQKLTVNYTVDGRGQLRDVWILTPEEAKEKRAGFGVERNYVFGSEQPATTPATGTTPAN